MTIQRNTSEQSGRRIVVRLNGPYLVQGDVRLVRKTQVVSEHGEPLTWKKEATLETKRRYALCRCGLSKNKPMCDGTRDDGGVVSLRGSYPAPPGPDWGWRIELENHERASLVMRMINISPEGQEALAVLAQYERS